MSGQVAAIAQRPNTNHVATSGANGVDDLAGGSSGRQDVFYHQYIPGGEVPKVTMLNIRLLVLTIRLGKETERAGDKASRVASNDRTALHHADNDINLLTGERLGDRLPEFLHVTNVGKEAILFDIRVAAATAA